MCAVDGQPKSRLSRWRLPYPVASKILPCALLTHARLELERARNTPGSSVNLSNDNHRSLGYP